MSEENEEATLHEDLAAAFDELETGEEEVTEAPAPVEDAVATPEEPIGEQQPEEPEQPEQPEQPVEAAKDDKAPVSWAPAEREEWGKIPDNIKAVVHKREREVQNVLQESATARHHLASFSAMIQPYQGVFAAQGIQDPLEGVKGVLQTTAQLQGGTPQTKAETVARLIKDFGVSITDLDNVLVGQPAPSAASEIQDPRLDTLMQQVNGMQSYFQQQGQTEQQRINDETNQFIQANEFASDLRGVMADFMDLASKQNQTLTLQQAYDRAVATRPDIQQILANRKQLESSAGNIAKARRAGSSVPSHSDGAGAPNEPTSLRGALAQAWDNA